MKRPCPTCGFVREVHYDRPDILCRSCQAASDPLMAPDALTDGEWLPEHGIQRWRPYEAAR